METNKWTYYNMVGGRITTQLKERPTDDEINNINTGKPYTYYVERVNKSGKTVHELSYDSLKDVFLRSVRLKTDDFGDSLEIKFFSEINGNGVLTVPVESNYFRSFCAKLPNFNISIPVDIYSYYFDTDGKISKGLWFKQGGIKVENAFTKEKPNGLPQPTQVPVGKKIIYDWSKQTEFYEDLLKKTFTDFSKMDVRKDKTTSKTTVDTSKTDAYIQASTEQAIKKSNPAPKETLTVPVGDDGLPWA